MTVARRAVFKLLRYSGLPLYFRAFVQKGRVPILTFHDPDPALAEPAFAYLSQHYDLISLERYVRACERGDAGSLPARALIVTFDDGHRRNYQLLPILERYRVPATLFVCSGIVDTNRHFWFFAEHPAISTVDLKSLPTEERLERLAEVGFEPEREYPTPQALDGAQMRAMTAVVDIQSHTMFHPCLHRCTEEVARREIVESKTSLERDFELRVWAIAYPNGDYTEGVVRMVREAGYRCGVSIDSGYNTIDSDLYTLKRIETNDAVEMDEFVVRSSGVWDALKRLFRRGRRNGPVTATGAELPT